MSSPQQSGLWYRRVEKLPSGLWLVEAHDGLAHPDGSVHDAGAATGDEAIIWRTVETDRGLLRLEYPHDIIPDAPHLWFVEIDDPRATPIPSTHLVAFATDHFPAGTVISKYTFAGLGVHSDTQAGAVNWHTNGLVRQVYVPPAMRRRFVGTALLRAADAWHQARGIPGRVHGDGRRTKLGEMLVATTVHPQRYKPLSETMPEMD